MAGVDQLEFTPGDANWHKCRKKALGDLYFFASTICGYGPRVPMTEAAHRILCKMVERKTKIPALDTARIRKFEMPRGTGKTTVITQAYLIQLICGNPNISIMLANENATLAEAILSEIKQQFEHNELLRSLFPEVIPEDFKKTTWNTTEIVVRRTESRKEPTIFVVGTGGTRTGFHPDVIFIDDMISREAMEAARSGSVADVMGKANRWVHQLIPLLSGAPYRSLDFIGTRWWYGDSYEHLEEVFGYGMEPEHVILKSTLEDGSVQRLPAYRVGDIAVFRRAALEDGQPAFISLGEDKFGLEALAKLRMQDPDLFAANMLNNPADELTATFKESWLRFYDWTSENGFSQLAYTDPAGKRRMRSVSGMDVVAFVDPGGFSKGRGGDRARPAIVVVGSADDLQFLLEPWSERVSYKVAIDQFMLFVRQYGVRKAYVEVGAQQRAFFDQLVERAKKEGLRVVFEEVSTGNKSKDDRILGLEEPFSRSTIYVGRGAKFLEFTNQYRQFPKSARKDLLDALSMMPSRVKRNQSQSASQRQQAELAAYYAKRGISPH